MRLRNVLGKARGRPQGAPARPPAYNREDCRRWADRYGIPFSYPSSEVFAERAARWARSPFHREELPARAYYAADAAKRDALVSVSERLGNVGP